MSFASFSEIIPYILFLVLLCGPTIGVVLGMISSYREPRRAIEHWATTHHFTLVSCRYRSLRRGPFFRFGRHNQVPVFYIVVTNQEGRTSAGWAKCDYPSTRLGAMTVEVRWDKPL